MKHVVIIGNGISGVTTARYVRKLSSHKITIISEETEHFFSRTALMYIYMGHMKYEHTKPYEDYFWKKNNIELVFDTVNQIDFTNKQLHLSNTESISYDKLVLATGSLPNKFGWKGQDLKGVQGMYSYQDLQKIEERTPFIKRAVIVGGGLIGVEMAEMFHSRNIAVSFLVREKLFWNNVLPKEEANMVTKHLLENHIDLSMASELDQILDDGNGSVAGIITKEGEKIDCQFVGLTVGVHPNIDFVKNTALETDRGILINNKQETNIKDVYSVGDCAQHIKPPEGRRNLEQVWYTGKIQAINCAKNICGKASTYQPGIWFNSAKFFDIEYHVYGDIPSTEQNEIASIFWQNEAQNKSIRINYHKSGGFVTGFNLMGVRYRHKVCDTWLREKTNIKEVLKNLKAANFDPEFHKRYEAEIIAIYNRENPNNTIQLSKKWALPFSIR